MSTAERTRAALRRHPFVALALRAGILNYRATARYLDCGDADAVAAALRREHAAATDLDVSDLGVRVRLARNVDPDALAADGHPVLGHGIDASSVSTVTVAGTLGSAFVPLALLGLAVHGIDIHAHVATAERAVFVVGDHEGASALRAIEEVASAVPTIDAG